jgi:hypothetical protein
MKKPLVTLLAVGFAATALTSPAISAGKKMGHSKSAKTKTCSVCHMKMTKKKSAMATVKVKGGYYCCAQCSMGAGAMKHHMHM